MSFNNTLNQTISRAADSNLPEWSDRISGILVPCISVVFAVLQGIAVLCWGIESALVTIGLAYTYFVFRWPHLALIAGVVFIFDGLGFIDPEIFLRVPGAFKFRDLLFVSLLLPLLLNTKWHKRARFIFRHTRSLVLPILVILFLTTLQMFRTSLQYDLPLNTCIMAGRHYWYYAFFLLAAIYLDTPHKQKVVFRLFLLVILTLASVAILQTVVLIKGGAFFLAGNIQVQPKQWGTLKLLRIYLAGEPALVLGFALTFWGVVLSKSARAKIIYSALSVICAMAIIILSSRMRWAHTLLVILIPVFFLGPYIPKTGRRLLGTLVLFMFIFVFLSVLSGRSSYLLSGIGEYASSGWTDFSKKEGSWAYRLEDNHFRIQLIKKHPLFGVGFVHLSYAWMFGAEEKENQEGELFGHGITTTDSGIIALLVDLGLVGAIWSIWYFVSVLSFCSNILKSSKNGDLRWMSVPLISYMIGGLLTLLTLCLFTMKAEIVGLSITLGILASNSDIQLKSKH